MLFSNLSGIVADKIEQSFYSVYSYSGIESIEHALIVSQIFFYDVVYVKVKDFCQRNSRWRFSDLKRDLLWLISREIAWILLTLVVL